MIVNGVLNITVQMMYKNVDISSEHNKNESEVIQMEANGNTLARVKYSTGLTINLGDYNSARVDLGIEIPSDLDKVSESYEWAADFCSDKLTEEFSNLMNLKKTFQKLNKG